MDNVELLGIKLEKNVNTYISNENIICNATMDGLEICVGVILERRKYTKYLGVYVDENLSWDIHVSFVERKI